MRLHNRLICLLIAILTVLSLTSLVVFSETENQIVQEAEKRYDFPALAGTTQGAWLIWGINKLGGEFNKTEYLKALAKNLPESDVNTVTNLHRIAITVNALGGDARNFNGRDIIAESVFYRENLGIQGVNGYIWALIALDSDNYEIPEDALVSRESLIASISEAMLENGSYSLNGTLPDTDITSMAITALAPYYESNEAVKASVDKSLNWLSATQKSDGGFSAWGIDNAETTAQVIIALCSLGIDFESDERFIKNGNTPFDRLMKYRIEGEGFAHVIDESGNKSVNDFATAQAICAIAAINDSKNGNRFFDLNKNDIETDKELISSAPESEDSKDAEKNKSVINPKFALISVALAVGILILLIIAKKVSRKTDIFIVIVAIAVIIALFVNADIQSTEEYYQAHLEDIESDSPTVILSIKCDKAMESDLFKQSLIEEGYIPENGIILPETEYVLREGDSVFEILNRAVRHEQIQMEYQGADGNTLGTVYIEGISYLYEFDCGSLSGWIYTVNGESPNLGISQYFPKNGDIIEVRYAVDYTLEQ